MMEHQQACSRYQALHNEDDSPESPEAVQSNVPTLSSQTLPAEQEVPPPPYSSVSLGATASATETDFQSDLMPVPPPYSVATSLPTYDEAEKAKAAAMAAGAGEAGQREEDFPPRDDFNDADQLRVGNDGIFMLAFFMAFLFNWIGFCLSFCLTNTIAGRYGAICGFGLSLIKWILIVRFSDYFNGYFNGQYWLWWIFLVLGFVPDLPIPSLCLNLLQIYYYQPNSQAAAVFQRFYQLSENQKHVREHGCSTQDQTFLLVLENVANEQLEHSFLM